MSRIKISLILDYLRPIVYLVSIFLITLVVSSSYSRGMKLEQERDSEVNAIRIPKVHYGDTLPSFRLNDTEGKAWTNSDLVGGWTVLSFVSTDCSACRSQLEEFNGIKSPGSHNQIIAITTGDSFMESASSMCKRFASDMHLTFPLLVDEGGEVTKRCRDSHKMPFTMLLDPKGQVRYIMEGYHAGEFKEQALRYMHIPYIEMKPHRADFKIDGILKETGTSRSLHDVIHHGWTVLTVARYGCPACNERANMLARFRYDDRVQCYLLFSSEQEAAKEQAALQGLPFHCVSNEADLQKQLRVRSIPETYVFYNGSLASVQDNGNDDALWALLAAIQDGHIRTNHSPTP